MHPNENLPSLRQGPLPVVSLVALSSSDVRDNRIRMDEDLHMSPFHKRTSPNDSGEKRHLFRRNWS